MAGDRRADLNSLAVILIAYDVGLEEFKMTTKSIKQRKEYVRQYSRDEKNLTQIRTIVSHTILEEKPLFDLRDINIQLNMLGEAYTSFLRVKQE